ncbi:MAG: helix-turn-helix domain-containing protein [Emcibacteraceae bacterium]|nr:helix-turn-helix domain-containing protein [Emcibacteraceae bacterium]
MTTITTTPTKNLSPREASTLRLLQQNPYGYVSTFEFRKNGVVSPAQSIHKLKKKDFIIERIFKPALDDTGAIHNKVAWYHLKGRM